jgi:nucleoporin p58/p45
MGLASNVASLHSEVEALKRDYSKWYAATHRSVRDPFGMAGMESTL